MDIDHKQILWRTNQIFQDVYDYAANKKNVTIDRVLRLLLTRSTTKEDTQIVERLWGEEILDKVEPVYVVTTLTVYSDSNLLRQTYTIHRKILTTGNVAREHQNQI